MRTIIERLIDDFHERNLPDLCPRERKYIQIAGKANVIIGMRRTGKTWFCYQQMARLLQADVKKNRILYFNFEDERLLPFEISDFQMILDTYYSKYPELKDVPCYLFLDEIHRIDGWEHFVRRILDSGNFFVCITGSSSKLLSREIATTMRGRSITSEIFPFSFAEFLRFNGISSDVSEGIGSRRRAILQNMMSKYLEVGGFPEIQSLDQDIRRQILRNYVDVAILRDVVERYEVSNLTVLRYMIRQSLHAPASRYSINKLYNSLRSQGVSCTKNALYEYFNYLVDAFLLYGVPIYHRSEHIRRVNPQKVYLVDTGLIGALSYQMTEDRGALLENLVYMHLRRHGLDVSYYMTRSGREVDFVVHYRDGKRELIQVSWQLNDPEVMKREIIALSEGMDELEIESATLVTWLDEIEIDEPIEVIPVWRWLLREMKNIN